ncbi:MAG: hypothetical protein ACLUFV_11770, partial [Acutalibacteraceae bacterium]
VAIQQHFRASAERPFYSCIFDRTTSRFCSWAISKGDTLIYGGVFEPKGCREAFEAQKKRLPKADFDLRTPIYTEACAVLRPEGMRQFRLGYDNAFLVGEAAGFISPTSFEGISWAITGAAAGRRPSTPDASSAPNGFTARKPARCAPSCTQSSSRRRLCTTVCCATSSCAAVCAP